MRSKVQKLAQFAYECVKEVKGKEFASKYLAYARKLPSMIIYNGLLTTVAFAKAKAKKHLRKLKLKKKKRVTEKKLKHWLGKCCWGI
jgi:CRISPR-associated protein Cmr5